MEGEGEARESARTRASPCYSSRGPGRRVGDRFLPQRRVPPSCAVAPPLGASPPTDWASASDTCVMEKRDTGAGDTVKREKAVGAAGVRGAAGVGAAGSSAGASGKSSSHSNPPPASRAPRRSRPSHPRRAWPRPRRHGPAPPAHRLRNSHASRHPVAAVRGRWASRGYPPETREATPSRQGRALRAPGWDSPGGTRESHGSRQEPQQLSPSPCTSCRLSTWSKR